jgi:hypothetical protein
VVFRLRGRLGVVLGRFLGECAARRCWGEATEAADFQERNCSPEEDACEQQVQARALVHGLDDSLGWAAVQRFRKVFGASVGRGWAMGGGKEVDSCGLRW